MNLILASKLLDGKLNRRNAVFNPVPKLGEEGAGLLAATKPTVPHTGNFVVAVEVIMVPMLLYAMSVCVGAANGDNVVGLSSQISLVIAMFLSTTYCSMPNNNFAPSLVKRGQVGVVGIEEGR